MKKHNFFARVGQALKDPVFRARKRRNVVAANLAIAVGQSGLSRTAVAEGASIKPSQLTRQLSGDENLTLDSIGKICDAIGWDFDVVFRSNATEKAWQPWEEFIFDIEDSPRLEISMDLIDFGRYPKVAEIPLNWNPSNDEKFYAAA